jgi:hypothetical protein
MLVKNSGNYRMVKHFKNEIGKDPAGNQAKYKPGNNSKEISWWEATRRPGRQTGKKFRSVSRRINDAV